MRIAESTTATNVAVVLVIICPLLVILYFEERSYNGGVSYRLADCFQENLINIFMPVDTLLLVDDVVQ